MKTEKILEEVKSRIDIVEFISDYVNLKKAGQNYKGLCPFHSEKTPSFMVSQSKQIFHCFGCGVGGDVVTFLMKHDNLPFPEALRYIATKAGVRMTDPGPARDRALEKRTQILLMNEVAMKFFISNLKTSPAAMAYLKKRGIDQESVERFRLGFASDVKDGLMKHMNNAGFSESLLISAGLVVHDARGCRDLFRGRIIFPIFSLKDDVLAFGGRVMNDSLPKYLNSPETEIFKKGEILFAVNLAKDEIRKSGYAIIVEGYLDVIICHQYGFKNTVAPLGTALTSRHLQKLKFLTKKVVLVFDGDEAGVSAARRSLVTLCENDFKAKILLLPGGEDPDSFLRKNGIQNFKEMLSRAISMTEFIFTSSKEDRRDTARETLGMIAAMNDLILADDMLRELSDRSGIHESVLRSELEKIKRKSGAGSAKGAIQAEALSNREEYLLLSALIAFPEKSRDVFSRLNMEDIKDKTVRSVLHKMQVLQDHLTIDSLLDEADNSERALITKLSFKPGFDLDLVDRNIDDCLHKLAQRTFQEKRMAALSKEPEDIELHNSLLKEKRRLIKGESS